MDGVTAAGEERRIWSFGPSADHLARVTGWYLADYESLLRFAYFLTRDQASAEDLVQEAFARVSTATHRLAEEGLSAYARRTVFNLHTSAFRRRRIERRILGLLPPPETVRETDVAGTVDMRRALMSLPPRARACLALRYYEDLPEAQIAEVMSMSLSAVKKEIERAKKRLRDALGERGSS